MSVWEEEAEAVCAVYGEENVDISLSKTKGKLVIRNVEPILFEPRQYLSESEFERIKDTEEYKTLKTTFDVTATFEIGYPESKPPKFNVSVPWLPAGVVLSYIKEALDYAWSPGQEAICSTVMYLSERLPLDLLGNQLVQMAAAIEHESTPPNSITRSPLPIETLKPAADKDEHACRPGTCSYSYPHQIQIHHGDTFTDRKSVFQPHLAKVKNMAEVHEVVNTLLGVNKIARAAHNMVAYRLRVPKAPHTKVDETNANSFLIHQDHDSDGETGAGSNMQWLLDTMGAVDVCVIVTRWWGGTKLGPDRFRHINNVTRQIIEDHGCSERAPKKKK